MPSGGLIPASDDDAMFVYSVLQEAETVGLTYDWLRYFIGGLQDGVNPREAADRAAEEWDF